MKKLLLLLLIGLGYHSLARTVVNHDDPGIRYMGRTSVKDGATILSWPGNSVCINFNGTSVVATLADEYGQSYYNVVIDGKVDKVIR